MAIQYSINAVDNSLFQVAAIGDGTSATLSIPLLDPPLNLNLRGNLPSFVSGNPIGSITLSADSKTVIVTFNPVLGANANANFGVRLFFLSI